METKYYIRHTGFPGGQRTRTVKEQLVRKPEAVVEHAVKGMLPKTKLGAELFRNLYVYVGADHKHEAQQPKELKFNTTK
jgi:large subunit ribosomal protein L13